MWREVSLDDTVNAVACVKMVQGLTPSWRELHPSAMIIVGKSEGARLYRYDSAGRTVVVGFVIDRSRHAARAIWLGFEGKVGPKLLLDALYAKAIEMSSSDQIHRITFSMGVPIQNNTLRTALALANVNDRISVASTRTPDGKQWIDILLEPKRKNVLDGNLRQ